jgi:hypothetical protein
MVCLCVDCFGYVETQSRVELTTSVVFPRWIIFLVLNFSNMTL